MARSSVTTDQRLHRFAARAANSLYTEQATSQILNWLVRMPDPDETLRKLGRNRASLRALEADDEISQCLDTRREAIIGTPWRLEPQQSRASKFIAEQLAPHIEDLVRGAVSAVLYGYSVIEVTYANVAGRVGIAKLMEKPLEWFAPQTDGTLRYFPDDGRGDVTGLEVDPRQFLLTRRHPSYRNPYGEALLSRLYWPFYFKTQGRRFWAQFLERFGFPILVGTVTDGQAFVDAMAKLGAVSPIAIPPGSTIEAITATQAGEFERFENNYARVIQKVILGQTLTSDIGDKGSYAAAKVHDAVRKDKRNADIRLVSATIQRLVNVLAELNGLQAPKFVLADDTGLELERATRDATNAPTMRASGLALSRNYWTDRYDYADEDLVEIAPEPNLPAPPGAGEARAGATLPLLFAPPRFTAKQQAIEDDVDGVLGNLGNPLGDAEIVAAVRAATSFEEVEDNLLRLLPDANGAEFRRAIERATFAADILGYAHASATKQ